VVSVFALRAVNPKRAGQLPQPRGIDIDVQPSADPLTKLAEWTREGHRAALATVVETWGSSPRPPGSHLAIRDDGLFAGSVSGGCIEGAVIEEAQEVMRTGSPRGLEFGVSNERAWEVGLACGGKVKVWVEPVE
jgi:xanthine/CO dehydrogenase XdhC/CoxF family maturation factor